MMSVDHQPVLNKSLGHDHHNIPKLYKMSSRLFQTHRTASQPVDDLTAYECCIP